MLNSEREPAVWAKFQQLMKRREELEEKNKPLREKQSLLREKQDELRKEEDEVVKKIKEQTPELFDIDAQLSYLAGVMGGIGIKAERP